MIYAICPLSVIPIRLQANEKSEMVTQLLFGEVVEIIKLSPRVASLASGWVQVRCLWDDYVGWVNEKQLLILSEATTETKLTEQAFAMCYEHCHAAMAEDYSIPITLGATLPLFDGIQLKLADRKFTFSGQAINPQQIIPTADFLLKIARKYLFAPYLWGGKSPFGIDCSGLVQMCYKMLNIRMPRDAYQQVEVGRVVDFVQQAQPGDLAFFDNAAGNIIHVGIVMANSMIIHASGRVRIDHLDHYGIFNEELKKYSHKLRIVKRILPDAPLSQYPINENVQQILAEPMPDNNLKLF
jgi:gamma-D-glutamyl-L-lysine dipeptidyl-peptidase